MNTMFDDETRVLELAREWKAGRLTPVHPSVGRKLNAMLLAHGEAAVPFKRATDPDAPSIVDLVRTEHTCAPDGPTDRPGVQNGAKMNTAVQKAA